MTSRIHQCDFDLVVVLPT